MSMKKILIIVGVVAVVVILVVANLNMSSSKAIKVQSDLARKRDLVEVVSASGRIQPKTKVDITSQINGEIIALEVREGDHVQSGDLLIVLDTVQLRSDVDQARYAVLEINARLEGTKTSLDEAKEEYDRQAKLYKSDLTSETAYNNAHYAYLKAKSSYEATKAQASQFQARYEKQLDNLKKAKIVAPMTGILTYVDCEVGEIAAAQTAFTQGRKLMTISNLDVFEVEVEVDETEIAKLELGQEAEIEVDAFPDTTFTGEVVEIGNTAILSNLGGQDQSTNFKVKVIFHDPNVKIRPGMSATVDITSKKRNNTLSVPYSAIVMRSFDADSLAKAQSGEQEKSAEDGVHAVEDDSLSMSEDTERDERVELKGVYAFREGKATFLEVKTGIADQKYIEVLSGLKANDTVVTGPYRVLRSIKEGDEVVSEKKKKKGRDK